jgi:outer membrane protein assembly factor BamB
VNSKQARFVRSRAVLGKGGNMLRGTDWRRASVQGAIVLPLLFVLGACNSWSTFGYGGDHSGFNGADTPASDSNVIGVSNIGDVTLAGNATTNSPVQTQPIVSGQTAYVTSAGIATSNVVTTPGTLYAFPAYGADGTNGGGCAGTVPDSCPPLWTATPSSDHQLQGSPTVADGVIYVSSRDGELYAYDAAGKTNCGGTPKVCQPLWHSPLLGGSLVSSPVVATEGDEQYVFVTSVYGGLYAFDAGTGTSDNCTNPGALNTQCGWDWGASTPDADIYGSPAVSNGVVYLLSDSNTNAGQLYAYDANGATEGLNGASCPTVAETWGSTTYCNPLWTTSEVGGGPMSPVVADGAVYVGSTDYGLYAFDASGCSAPVCPPLWTAPTAREEATPAVADGVVYVPTENVNPGTGELYAFGASGTTDCSDRVCSPLWTASTSAMMESSPAIANGVVYVSSSEDSGDATLYAFDASGTTDCSGGVCSPIWRHAELGPSISSSPSVASGLVYIGTEEGEVEAFARSCTPEC